MYLKTKSGRKVQLPTDEEDARINAQIAADPDEEELGDDFFENAVPSKDVFPEIIEAQQKGELEVKPVGRPKSDNPKKQLTLRLSPEVVEYFKSTGKGWQTRIDEALKEYVSKES